MAETDDSRLTQKGWLQEGKMQQPRCGSPAINTPPLFCCRGAMALGAALEEMEEGKKNVPFTRPWCGWVAIHSQSLGRSRQHDETGDIHPLTASLHFQVKKHQWTSKSEKRSEESVGLKDELRRRWAAALQPLCLAASCAANWRDKETAREKMRRR